jgi:5-methylcytosine-specific restriction endonuclease McrA
MPPRDRNYRAEYDSYHAKPEQKKKRAMRNAARSEMQKAGKVSKGDGKEVDHKVPLRGSGTNAASNLRVTSESKNRAWRKGKS